MNRQRRKNSKKNWLKSCKDLDHLWVGWIWCHYSCQKQWKMIRRYLNFQRQFWAGDSNRFHLLTM